MISEQKLIESCISGKRRAHGMLYNKYAATMLGICMRFCRNREDAQDVLQEGFIKVFTRLPQFRKEGSLEGWIRRIMVNTAINYYHSQLRHTTSMSLEEISDNEVISGQEEEGTFLPKEQTIPVQSLMEIIQQLPDGYRMVFNLYVMEGYSHKEIAEILQISENTSKSQLFKARKYLIRQIQEKLSHINIAKAK